jgi:plastocyanin
MKSVVHFTVGSLIVAASALVLLAVLTLAGCSNGSGGYMSPTAPSPTPYVAPDPVVADLTINIVGMAGSNSYSPNPSTVKVGQKVAWYNADSISHTATADGGSFNTGTIAPGGTSTPITMASAGTFPYHCAIHGLAMTGTLVVTP